MDVDSGCSLKGAVAVVKEKRKALGGKPSSEKLPHPIGEGITILTGSCGVPDAVRRTGP